MALCSGLGTFFGAGAADETAAAAGAGEDDEEGTAEGSFVAALDVEEDNELEPFADDDWLWFFLLPLFPLRPPFFLLPIVF